MGGRAEGQACADPWARTPIGTSRILICIVGSKFVQCRNFWPPIKHNLGYFFFNELYTFHHSTIGTKIWEIANLNIICWIFHFEIWNIWNCLTDTCWLGNNCDYIIHITIFSWIKLRLFGNIYIIHIMHEYYFFTQVLFVYSPCFCVNLREHP